MMTLRYANAALKTSMMPKLPLDGVSGARQPKLCFLQATLNRVTYKKTFLLFEQNINCLEASVPGQALGMDREQFSFV